MALCALLASSGCSRFRAHTETQYVYVIAKQSILRDRIAAVSNRIGEVTNGEKLEVLERDRRFVKVKTPNGAIGWLEDRLTADQPSRPVRRPAPAARKDPVVASGTATDDVYLHIIPGRETDRFYRLAEGDSVSLLAARHRSQAASPGTARRRLQASTARRRSSSAARDGGLVARARIRTARPAGSTPT